MNKPLKLIKIGNSTGVILPKEVLARMRVALGDELSIADTPQGVELRPREEDFDSQMAVARDVMAQRHRALRELAK